MRAFVKKDIDGFFGLFVDNIVQLLLIIELCTHQCGMPRALLYGTVLPGAAISILLGNLFYAWQAHRLAKQTGRDDVTALPYGINTVSLLAFVFFVMMPEYQRTQDPVAAWRLGLVACLGSGVIELLGAFVAERIRRSTPRAALLSTLAGIAIGFISMTFALQIFQKPLVAMLPLAIILVGLFSGVRLPLGLPSGLLAVASGTAIAWIMTLAQGLSFLPDWATFGAGNVALVQSAFQQISLQLPSWCGPDLLGVLQEPSRWLPFLSVVIPMGLFNIIGSLQNIESAEAAGDKYPMFPSMAVNGLGSVVAAFLGSCFPTTIYIGHPGWKAMGARAGYSTLNGIVIVALSLFGLVELIAAVIPIEAGAAIVLWIGIIITAQAFQATPPKHAPAVAMGLFPAIAAWGGTVMMGALLVANGTPLQQLLDPPAASAPLDVSEAGAEAAPPAVKPVHPTVSVNGFLVHAMLLMERGYIFTCMILAACVACLIDRKFVSSALWMFLACGFTVLGVMHSYQVFAGVAFDHLFRFGAPAEGAYLYRADDIAIAYLVCGLFFLAVAAWVRKNPDALETPGH